MILSKSLPFSHLRPEKLMRFKVDIASTFLQLYSLVCMGTETHSIAGYYAAHMHTILHMQSYITSYTSLISRRLILGPVKSLCMSYFRNYITLERHLGSQKACYTTCWCLLPPVVWSDLVAVTAHNMVRRKIYYISPFTVLSIKQAARMHAVATLKHPILYSV